MRILHLSFSDYSGGATKAAYRLHSGLKKQDIESYMYVARKLTNDCTVFAPSSNLLKSWLTVTPFLDRLPLFLYRNSNNILHSPSWVGLPVQKIIGQMNPDIVQLHWFCAGFLRIESLLTINRPIVWRLPDMWAFGGSEHYCLDSTRYIDGYTKKNRVVNERGFDVDRWTWRRKRSIYRRLNNLTIVTPSRWLHECASKSILLNNKKIVYIPTGHNTTIFKPVEHIHARKCLGLPTDKKIIMFCGSTGISDYLKGYDLFRTALQTLYNEFKDRYVVVIAGEKPVHENDQLPFQTYCFENLKDDISLSIIYAACDVVIVPSRQDNLPNTAIEAMACGTPVVGFNIGGLPDIISHKQNGYIAQPFDISELACGITWVLSDSDRWNKLSINSRATVEKDFSSQKQAERYSALYQNILNDKPDETK